MASSEARGLTLGEELAIACERRMTLTWGDEWRAFTQSSESKSHAARVCYPCLRSMQLRSVVEEELALPELRSAEEVLERRRRVGASATIACTLAISPLLGGRLKVSTW